MHCLRVVLTPLFLAAVLPSANYQSALSSNAPRRDVPLRVGMQSGISVIVGGNVTGRVSVALQRVTPDQAANHHTQTCEVGL
jgi:hypothetical protein